mgnify:FL=1
MESRDLSDLMALAASVVDKYDDELVALRREVHRQPELAWHEHATVERIVARLEGTGWALARTPRAGLIADLGTSGPRVALRTDLDALPVDDLTADPWRSQTPGVAHSCGHPLPLRREPSCRRPG